MGEAPVSFEIRDRVAVITLNRPERLNAWNAAMDRELSAAMQRVDLDDAIRAAVVTGAGRAFCAGADLEPGGGSFADSAGRRREPPTEARERPASGYGGTYPWMVRKPVLAAINGHAVGVGITYPMTCDVRIVAEDAKIQFAFVRRGVLPEFWSHVIVPEVVGLSRAAELLMLGRMVRGREMAEMGLASEALPAQQVLEATLERAREAADCAPVSVALSKRLLWEGLRRRMFEIGPREAKAFSWVSGQADAREGVVSFLEKRSPDWKLSASEDTPDV